MKHYFPTLGNPATPGYDPARFVPMQELARCLLAEARTAQGR